MKDEEFEDSEFNDENCFEEYQDDSNNIDYENEEDYVRMLAEEGEGFLVGDNESFEDIDFEQEEPNNFDELDNLDEEV